MGNSRPAGSTTSHIFRLPVEVLQEIFEQAVLYPFNKDPIEHSGSLDRSRCALSSVCSWWRDMVISHHVLWASISYMSRNSPSTSLNWIRLCLLRSGHCDIHLAIDFTNDHLLLPATFSHRNRNSTIGHLISFLDTMEDDMERVSRLSINVLHFEHMQQLIIPHAHFPRLKRLLLQFKFAPVRDIRATMLGNLEELGITGGTMDRATLASLLAQCPSLQRLSLRTNVSSRHCRLGQSAQPVIHAPLLHTLYLNSVLPARAFDAPQLKKLVSFPNSTMGRLAFWWETNHFRVGTTDHHEQVAPEHFPSLRKLTLGTFFNDMDYLEPSIRLIRAHSHVCEIRLQGHDGARNLLAGAFRRAVHSRSTIDPPDKGDGSGASAPSEDDTKSETHVPVALRSLWIYSERVGSDNLLADALRRVLRASDVLGAGIAIWHRNPAEAEMSLARGYPDYMALSTEFPGRFDLEMFIH